MQKPLVSILTPFKNTERFLHDCITSIKNQSYTNWELIIVDDNSTDNSINVVKKFAKDDARIICLKNNGNGIIAALKLAYKNSKGNLITRMDSDDIMMPNKLEILTTALLKHGKNHVAIGLVEYFSEDGVGSGYKNYQTWLNNLTMRGTNYDEIYKECVIPSPCWMTYREDLQVCGAFNYDIYPEDYDLTFRFYKHNLKCIPCNITLHKWRDYSTRTSRTHIHYAQNHFTDLKIKYFLELDYNASKNLVIWGAGNKGKLMAKTLLNQRVNFYWICDNPKKIGKTIYGKKMLSFKALNTIKNTQSLITVANKDAQTEIKAYLKELHLNTKKDFIFFC